MSDSICVLDSVSAEASALPSPRVQTPLMPCAPVGLTATTTVGEPFDVLLADLLEGSTTKLTDAPMEVAADETPAEGPEVQPSDTPALLAGVTGMDPTLALLPAPDVEHPAELSTDDAPDRQALHSPGTTAAQPPSDGPIADVPTAAWDALSALSETPAPSEVFIVPRAPEVDSNALAASTPDDDAGAGPTLTSAPDDQVFRAHSAVPHDTPRAEFQALHTDPQPPTTASSQPSHEVHITSVRWVERLPDGTGRLELSLQPSHLGRVEVVVASDGSSVSATLLSPDQAVCTVLRTQLEALHTALLSAGIAVGELNVGLGGGERHDAPSPRPAGRGRSAAGAPVYAPDAPVVRQYRPLHGLAIDVFV